MPAAAATAASNAAVEVRVGTPPLPIKVSLELRRGQVFLRAGKLEQALPLTALWPLTAQSVAIGHGSVGVIHVAQPGQPGVAALLTRGAAGLKFVWTGDLRWRGDPSERVADAIETVDRDADGAPDIVVGTYDERVRVCGQEHTLLGARALDPHDFQLKAVPVSVLSKPAVPPESLATAAQSPGPKAPALLRALRVTGASSADPAAAASLLTDGRLDTAWVSGTEQPSGGELVVLRWGESSQPIRAFSIAAAASDAAHAALARPKKLTLVGDRGERWTATLDADPTPGQRVWLTPKQPLHTACLTLVVDEVYAPPGHPNAPVALAELEAYTDLDFAGGVDRLVAAALQDGPAAGDAADLLTQLDVDVSGALVAAWPRLSPQGKRRAVRVLAAQSLRGRGSLELLVRAVQDPDADVSRAGLDAMLAALPASEPMLEGLVGQAGALADRVIAALVRKSPTQAVALGLRAISAPGGSERPKLREAVAAGLEHAGALGVQAASAWIEAQPGPSVEARASAALAFSSTNAGLALAARLLGMSLEAAKAFPEQWRLLAAARSVPSEPAADAWLVQLATTAEPWMLRVAALQALAERHSAAAPSVATKALTDANPRVRSAALASLASAAGGVELLSKYARDDKWFLVRTAALDALPEGAGAEPVLRAALGDRLAVVRAAAVRGLRRVRSVAAWPVVAPHVENAQEYPEVIAEGIGFARALCVQDAAPALQGVVTRGLRPDAWGPDQELALGALETLGILGGKPGAWALEQARSPVVPPSVRTSIERNAKAATPCTPQP